MRAINISNEKPRNAQVGFEVTKINSDLVTVRADGMAFSNVRLLKATIDTEPEDLLRQYGDVSKVAQAIVDGDPEIDFEKVGMLLSGLKKVYLSADDKIAYRVNLEEVVYNVDGTEKDAHPLIPTEQNVNSDIPLKWTGKLIPKDKAVRMFVFARKYQLKHVDGLTYDFLYDMAKQLHEKNSLMLIGAGAKGTDPLVFARGGVNYRAFLEGRVDGTKYSLILHLTNLELKTI